ncbi:MAG: YihY family inner membrane protein [Magnetospirillum sp.]|nr:YihY family inner membrane protein [Magnetospirillum sp.]
MRKARLKARMMAVVGLVRYVLRRYAKDGASRIAASLSYTSLLSLVPLIAIALAMLAAFPVFDGVRATLLDWVFDNFVPSVGDAVQRQITGFIANAGKLTAAGIVGLAFTAVMLLITIEGSLNQVFRVARQRSAVSRILMYWTALTLGPLLIGASLSLQGYLTAVSKWTMTKTMTASLAAPLPTLLSMGAFFLMFMVVPARRVRIKDAAAGAVVAGLLFALLRWGFALYLTSSKAYATVYGAVASVPIFLLWMFLSWAVVLVGAEVAAALPEWRAGLHESGRGNAGGRRLALALEVLAILKRAAVAGSGGVARRDLLAETAVGESDLSWVLAHLTAGNFVAPTSNRRLLLARDLGAVPFAALIDTLDLGLALDEAVAVSAAWRPAATERLAAARRAADGVLAVTLAEVLAAAG